MGSIIVKRYIPLIEKRFRNVTTLEFFVKNGKLYVAYNDDEIFLFQDFCRDAGFKNLLKHLYKKLEKEFPELITNIYSKFGNSDWLKNMLYFINIYWSRLDNKYDILIGPGFVVDFNLER